jgi:hypothetical protein
MPVTVIAERLGWERGLKILCERVRELRPACLPANPVSLDPVSRTIHEPVSGADGSAMDAFLGLLARAGGVP